MCPACRRRRCDGVRGPLCAALPTFLALAAQAEAPAGPPAVVEALLQQGGWRVAVWRGAGCGQGVVAGLEEATFVQASFG